MLVPEQVFVIITVVAVNTIATVAKLHFILLHGLVSDLNATIGRMTAKFCLLMYLSLAPLRQIHHHHHHPPPSPPPSGGSASTYSPSYTGTGSSNVRIPTTTTRKATKATGKIAGIVVGVVVTFLIAVVKYCCFTKKNEVAEEHEQNTTPPVTVLVQQQNTEGRDETAAMPTMPMEAKQKPSPTMTDSTATSKFCTKCGSAIVSNGMFCASCGKAVSS